MTLWLFLSILSPFLFTLTNFVDKYLLGKIVGDKPVPSITILAGLAGVPFLIIFGILARHSLADYGLTNALGAVSAGALLITAYYFYYKALMVADASLVAALFQLIIPFNYVLGLIFLDEHLSVVQLVAVGIVLLGSVVLSLENHEDADDGRRRMRLNKSVFWYMFLSSLFIALSSVVFKMVAKDSAYLPTQFCEYTAGVIIGTLLFLCNRSARAGFLDILRRHRSQAVGLSGLNEILNLGGVVAMRYAMFLAPIAVVQAISSVQAIFLLAVGVALTALFPRFIKENIGRKHLLQKMAAIGIMILGTVLLALNT